MKLDFEQIRLINALGDATNANAKDCVIKDDTIVFLVPGADMKKAIGKEGNTIRAMGKHFGKNIELFEYNEKPEEFFSKAFRSAKVSGVQITNTNDRKIAVVKTGNNDKAVILHNLRRLDKIKELAKRNYEIEEVRIR